MKSLQLLTPSRKCIYNCPFCISKTHIHQNEFDNNFEKDFVYWYQNLKKVLLENEDLKTVVITGTNEPMQDRNCIVEMIRIIRRYRKDVQIELQTRYYENDELYQQLDVVAISISNFKMLDKIMVEGNIIRYVILLTDSFNNISLQQIISAIPQEVTQLTFKYLQDSSGLNLKLDNWINNHRMNMKSLNKLRHDIENYQGNISIFLDEHCMEAAGRYKVFREDGELYQDYEEKGR